MTLRNDESAAMSFCALPLTRRAKDCKGRKGRPDRIMSAVCLLLTIAPAWQHHQLLLPHALMRTPARATQQPAMLLGVRSKRRKKGEADWAERLDKDLGEAADLARRGGAVSHALLKAREAANEASSAAWEYENFS